MLDQRSRIRSSCRVTLPSYTVLPMRATTPPMIAGSTRVVELTRAAGRLREPVARARCTRSAGERRSPVTTSAAHDLQMVHQPLVDTPARAPAGAPRRSRSASSSSSFASGGCSVPARVEAALDDGALARRGNRRVRRGRAASSACSLTSAAKLRQVAAGAATSRCFGRATSRTAPARSGRGAARYVIARPPDAAAIAARRGRSPIVTAWSSTHSREARACSVRRPQCRRDGIQAGARTADVKLLTVRAQRPHLHKRSIYTIRRTDVQTRPGSGAYLSRTSAVRLSVDADRWSSGDAGLARAPGDIGHGRRVD